MQTRIIPDTLTKLAQLGNTTTFEPSGNTPLTERRRVPFQSHSLAECITNVTTPTGKMPIMKSMMTTACEAQLQLLSLSSWAQQDAARDIFLRRDGKRVRNVAASK